jgi:membrane-associated phospholipid phosphatase
MSAAEGAEVLKRVHASPLVPTIARAKSSAVLFFNLPKFTIYAERKEADGAYYEFGYSFPDGHLNFLTAFTSGASDRTRLRPLR